MAKISRIFTTIQSKIKHVSCFAPELLVIMILAFTVGTNFQLRASAQNAADSNRSLFFVFLKNNPALNEPLLEAYESVSVKFNQNTLPNGKQILAASTKDNTKDKESAALATSASIPLPTLSGSSLLKPNPASTGSLVAKRDKEVYTVRPGDTVARIALAYGISEGTIINENSLASSGLIKPGQQLEILPVTGVTHIVKQGETISSIAKQYGADYEYVLEYNDIEFEEHIFPGEEIVIPNGVKKAPATPERAQYLADLKREDFEKIEVPDSYQGGDSLIWPMPGAYRISQYFSSRHRAIDIPCRDCQVEAAADGIVELAGWQGAYGYTIILNHGNGLKTRYAHARGLQVSAGDQVTAGQVIMTSGSTGRSTGAHLHFEILKNGSFLNPLSIVKP